MKIFVVAVKLALFFAILSPARAQDRPWPPHQAIKFVVPTSAGGGTDILARQIGERLHESLGANFIVEDRPGSAGNVGTMLVLRAAPDGTTFLFTQGAHTSNVAFFKSGYDAVADFEPVAIIGTISFMVCVNGNSPMKTFAELIDVLHAKGDRITYGSAGYATSSHLAMELFKSLSGINVTHVPYHGTTPATTALLAGEVDFGVVTDYSIQQYVASGRVRCLASTGRSRSSVFPQIPTIAEAVPLPGYEQEAWYGILGPAKLARDIVEVMNREVNRLVRDPAFVVKNLVSAGITPTPTTPEVFKERLKDEVRKYSKLAKDAHISPQ